MVVPHWERMKDWELLSSYLGESSSLSALRMSGAGRHQLAAPFLRLGVVKHRCLIAGHRHTLLPGLTERQTHPTQIFQGHMGSAWGCQLFL